MQEARKHLCHFLDSKHVSMAARTFGVTMEEIKALRSYKVRLPPTQEEQK